MATESMELQFDGLESRPTATSTATVTAAVVMAAPRAIRPKLLKLPVVDDEQPKMGATGHHHHNSSGGGGNTSSGQRNRKKNKFKVNMS